MRKLGSRRWTRDYSCGWKSVLFCSSSAHWDREWECEQERPPGFQPPVGCRLPSCSLPLSSTGPANGGDHGDMSRRAILGSRAEHLPLLQIYLQPSDSTYLCSLLQWVLGPRPRGSWIALSFPPRGPSGPTAFWYLRREWWKEMYDMTHPFTPWSFCSGHTGLLALSWTCCVLSCLSAFAYVVPFAWKALSHSSSFGSLLPNLQASVQMSEIFSDCPIEIRPSFVLCSYLLLKLFII